MKYKVWVHIEEIDEEADHYEDVARPIGVGEFETIEDAQQRVGDIYNVFMHAHP